MWSDKFPKEIIQEIQIRGLPIEQISFIKDWPIWIIELILSFKMGYNKTLQVINYLNEISLRDDKPIDTHFKSREWLEVYNNPKIPMYQKGLWFRKFLFNKRYPVYTESIEKKRENEVGILPKIGRGYTLNDKIAQSKRNIRYLTHKGKFLKKCPGTLHYLCCNYYVLNIQTNCNYDCQYCILQGYINSEGINIYTNIDTALKELGDFLNNHPEGFYRIGTGELTDSLSLDHLTNTSMILIPFFIQQKNALLELKTKSNNIKNLMKLHPNGNIVISWSINPQRIIDTYETNTATLIERLESAKECVKNGYRIGFHIDPIILYHGWEIDYKDMISKLFNYIEPNNIVWISIAGFRYTPKLKNIIIKRHPDTKLFLGEMLRCEDGKYRYIYPIRTVIYRKIVNWLKEYDKDLPIYLCMESPEIWKEIFGKLPTEINNLKGIFGPPVKPCRIPV